LTESTEDKLIRILTRAPFEVVDSAISEFLEKSSTRMVSEATEIYKNFGWTRNEYHREWSLRAENRRRNV